MISGYCPEGIHGYLSMMFQPLSLINISAGKTLKHLMMCIFVVICVFAMVNTCSAEKIHEAVKDGDFDKVKFYANCVKSVDIKDSSGRTPLHYAAQNGDIKIAEWLILKKADVNSKDHIGATPLYLAAANGNYEIAKLLISKGADVNARNNSDDTPIYWAMVKGEYIVEESYIKNQYGWGAKIIPAKGKNSASFDNYKKTISILLENRAILKTKNHVGHSPFYLAIWMSNNEMLKYILDNYKYDLNGEDGKGLLRSAVESGNEGAAGILIAHGADSDLGMITTALKDTDIDLAMLLAFTNITLVSFLVLSILTTVLFIIVLKKSYKTKEL
jgi:ankyrin repeat protein